jgi:hypothetical protein
MPGNGKSRITAFQVRNQNNNTAPYIKLGMKNYTKSFFSMIQTGSRRFAKGVVPIFMELVSPQHIIDVGYGQI